MKDKFKLFFSIVIPLLIYVMPAEWIPVEGLSVVEHRLIALFAMAALFWVLEPIPIFATSVLIIVLELVMVSDKSFVLFAASASRDNFGTVLSYKDIMTTFASPIIMLFLGGFFLAMASTKYQLDLNLARVLLKPFGQKPKYVLFGLMMITAMFSMFMSNTATTAMMLAILMPVLKLFDIHDRGRIAFVLGIPFAANIGGMGTPIGTPPNAIALKYLTGDNRIGFGTWMGFAVPFVIVMLVFVWLLLLSLYKPETKSIQLNIKGKFRRNRQAVTVYVTFCITIFLWLTDFLHGMNSYIVAMIPVAVFTVTRIMTAEDLKRINWDILWLLAGGIALGLGLEKSGLAQHVIESIPFDSMSPYLILFFATLITLSMASFMSNTATANLLLPLMGVLGATVPSLAPLGGSRMIILGVTFSASLAMAFVVSTPPNAIAYATGEIKGRHMLKPGLIIGITGLAGIYVLLFILKMVAFL